MSDLTEDYAAMRKYSRAKKQSNKEFSTSLLDRRGVDYESKNNGIHLVVYNRDEIIDFYPSTGKWIPRGGKAKRGVLNLLKRIEREEEL